MTDSQPLHEILKEFYEDSTEESFQCFYESLYRLSLHTAFYVTKNYADAEDVTQQSFMIVFRKVNLCNTLHEKLDSKIKSWFLSIVYNQARMFLRHKIRNNKHEKIKSQDSSLELNSKLKIESEDKVMSTTKLQSAIEDLPEKYRTPIILKYKEGLDNQIIGEILQLNQSTLRNRISRGIHQLKAILFKDEKEIEELLPSIALLPLFGMNQQIITPKFSSKKAYSVINQTRFVPTKAISVFVGLTVLVTSFALFFYITKNQMKASVDTVETNVKSLPVASENIKLDYSKGELPKTEILNGTWMYMSNIRVPEQNNDIFIRFDKSLKSSYCRLIVDGGPVMLKNQNHIDYAVQGIYLSTDRPIKMKDVYINKRTKKNFYLDSKDIYIQNEQAVIVFIDQYIITEYEGKISKICLTEGDLKIYNFLGLIINSFGIKNIEYQPISPEQIKIYQDKIKKLIE